MTKLKTLDELEENSSLNIQILQQNEKDNTSQIEQIFNIKEEDRSNSKRNNHLDPNMILSPRSTYSNSSTLSRSSNLHGKPPKKMIIGSKSKRKTNETKGTNSVISERSISSMSNKSNIDDTTLTNGNDDSNLDSQSIISNLQKVSSIKLGGITNGLNKSPREPIDYDKISPNQCADLTRINYINTTEKYLITRLYSNVGKLSSILNELNSINLKYFLNTPDENDCLPLYYAIKAECTNTVKLLLEMGASLSKTTAAGDPAPHLACLLGVSVELIDFLLSFTGNTKKILYINDQEGWNILHCAANQGHLNIIKYLMEKKHMNPNVKDSKNRYTCLQLAAINNRIEVIEYFLSFNTLSSVINKHKSINDINFIKTSEENLLEIKTNNESNNDNYLINFNINTNTNNNNNNLTSCFELNNCEKNFHNIKPPASLTEQSVQSEHEKKHSISSTHTKAPSLEHVEKTHHSNSIDSDKSYLNLSYRSNHSSLQNIKNNHNEISNININRRSSISSNVTTASLIKKPLSKLSKYSNKKNHSNSISQISTISEYTEDATDYLDTDRTRSTIKKSSSKPIISLEPITVYLAANKFLTEPLSVYNNFLIDVDSQTSEGQNVLHLACRFGKYDIVKILLKKYGSNELDINAVDFKGKTCLDLAWDWCLNIFGTKGQNFKISETVNQISLFYDQDSSIYIQRCFLIDDNIDFEEQIKLINLLNSYGAKFSNYNNLMYDIDLLDKVESEIVNLPSNLFHPDDHVSFENIRLNINIVIPINYYLKCLLYLLKLKLPSMFLRKKTQLPPQLNQHLLLNRSQKSANMINRPSFKRAFTSISNNNDSFSSSSPRSDNNDNNETSNDTSSFSPNSLSSKSFIDDLKLDFSNNLKILGDFIKKHVIDSFECNLYYESIQEASELLKNLN